MVGIDGYKSKALVAEVFNELQHPPHRSMRGGAMRAGEIYDEDIVIGKVLQRVSLSIRSRKRESRGLVADVQGCEPVGQVFGAG